MHRLVLGILLVAFGASAASSQPYGYRDRYDERRDFRHSRERCSWEKREAQGHWYRAMRNKGGKGFLDAGEQRVQRQLQARYDACVAGYGRRRY